MDFFLFSKMLAVGLFYIKLIYILYILRFSRNFIMKEC